MGCCGQGRAAFRGRAATAGETTVLPGYGHGPTRQTGPQAVIVLRNVGNKRVRIRGPLSGALYEFAIGEQAAVAAIDAPLMVRTGLFKQA